MKHLFWTHTIWYILLGIFTLIEIAVSLYFAKNRKHALAFYFIISGMTFCIEAVMMCFLKSYDYYPKLIANSPMDENFAGNLFSQFSISATALLLSVLDLKGYWYFICSGIYGVIEETFLTLEVYSHNWYQTWMTVFGLALLFGATRSLYLRWNSYITDRGFARCLFMFFGLYTLHMPAIWWAQVLTGIVAPNYKLLSDDMNSYALVSLLNLFILSAACMYSYCKKVNWFRKSIIILTLYGVFYLAEKINWIFVKPGWFMIFSTINIFGMYFCIFIIDKLLSPHSSEMSSRRNNKVEG